MNGGDEVEIGSGLDPTEVLDSEFGVCVKPKERGFETEVEESDAALTVAGGEEEVGGGRLRGEEVTVERDRAPAECGDEGRE